MKSTATAGPPQSSVTTKRLTRGAPRWPRTASQVVDKLMASEHADVLRESVARVLAELMEAEVSTQIGAELGERAPGERTSQRNGYRPRNWSTRR